MKNSDSDTDTDTDTDVSQRSMSHESINDSFLRNMKAMFEQETGNVAHVFNTLLHDQTFNNNNLIAFDQFPGLFKAILKDGLPNVLPNINMELLNRYADDDESTNVCIYDTGTMMLRCIVRFLHIYSRLNNHIQVCIPWLCNVLMFLSTLQKNRILNTLEFLIRCRTYNDSEFDSDASDVCSE